MKTKEKLTYVLLCEICEAEVVTAEKDAALLTHDEKTFLAGLYGCSICGKIVCHEHDYLGRFFVPGIEHICEECATQHNIKYLIDKIKSGKTTVSPTMI